jgi:hypothetical protein
LKKFINYSLASKEDREILEGILMEEDYQPLKACNIRFAVILVTTTNEDGGVLKTFKCQPYKVKLISMKDRLLKNVDVEIHIDESYWIEALEQKKTALLSAALHQIEVALDKNDMPVFQDDGVVKLKLMKPDIMYFGFSEVIEKYGSDSPDIRAWDDLKSEFTGLLY